MRNSWNKGFTKDSHLSVRKISQTMKGRHLDNFKVWRDEMKKQGKIKNAYPLLQKNGDLAELIGVTLGDGYLAKFPRTDLLTISANSANIGFIERYANLIEKL